MMRRRDEGGFANDHRAPRSVCKICWCSIFDIDETVWVTRPTPGIAHAPCADNPDRDSPTKE